MWDKYCMLHLTDGLEENWTMMKYKHSGLMDLIQRLETIQKVQVMFLHIAFAKTAKTGIGKTAIDLIPLSANFQPTK